MPGSSIDSNQKLKHRAVWLLFGVLKRGVRLALARAHAVHGWPGRVHPLTVTSFKIDFSGFSINLLRALIFVLKPASILDRVWYDLLF